MGQTATSEQITALQQAVLRAASSTLWMRVLIASGIWVVLVPVLPRSCAGLMAPLGTLLAPLVSPAGAVPQALEEPRGKGYYELYSWKVGDDWYYSLVPGTNAMKYADCITSPAVRLKGADALKMLTKAQASSLHSWPSRYLHQPG
jgi:hypothetical protein